MADVVVETDAEGRATKPARVLVVDDTEGNRYAVSHELRAAGIEVIEAANGREALEALSQKPDLVVLDVNLPDISGHEILGRIRSDPEISWIPVMHVTATYTTSEAHARGLDLGADAYLTHPLDAHVFNATARSLLRLSKAESKVRRASKEWRAAFDSLGDAIFIVGVTAPAEGLRIQRCNRAAAQLMNVMPREAINVAWADALRLLDIPAESEFAKASSGGSGNFRATDMQLRSRWYSASVQQNLDEPDLGEFSVCVLRDITDRKQSEHEIEALATKAELARQDAEAANRAKGEFLAVMSHELRTPLNAIGGYVDLMSMGIRGPLTAEQASDLQRIKRSQTSLLLLINDLLNFAKVESGALEYHITSFPAVEALDGASELVEHQVRQREIELVRMYASCEATVEGDRDKIQQVVLNLLSNAIKFTPVGGRITLSIEESPETVSMVVSDTGSGIPPDMVEAIFEPFVQVRSKRHREDSGVGLGLAISRDLARAMRGELHVASSSSEGTSFRLTLPRG